MNLAQPLHNVELETSEHEFLSFAAIPVMCHVRHVYTNNQSPNFRKGQVFKPFKTSAAEAVEEVA